MTVPWLKLSVRDFASQSLKIFAIGKRNDRFLGSNYPWFCFSQLANLRNLDSAMILSWLKLLVRNFASQSLEIFAIWKALWPFFGSNFCLRFRSQNLKIFILWDPGHRGGLGRENCELCSHSKLAFPSRELRSRRDFDNALGIEDGKSSQIWMHYVPWLKLPVWDFASQSLKIFTNGKALWPFLGSITCPKVNLSSAKCQLPVQQGSGSSAGA